MSTRVKVTITTAQNTLMIQGTGSSVGKSLMTMGLCRLLARRGFSVAPFKPQNMSLNSAVTSDGGEIGRAQALQALAAGVEPHVHMNPVLLKPNSDIGAQVIVQGQVLQDVAASDYQGGYQQRLLPKVLESFHYLREHYDAVVIEGAGSPAEINLRDNDIANMGFAEAADVPVVLVGDIDKGGVFAQLCGTMALLSASEQARVTGFIINKFRGDLSLLTSGLRWLEDKTQKPVFGVLPYLHGLQVDEEDSLNQQQQLDPEARLTIVVPVLPHMSNHTDFDVLRLHPEINLQYAYAGAPLPAADVIILPGTKNVRADLEFLREQGWQQQIERHLRYGGKLIGICGGYQMLGEVITDPDGVEGESGESRGLGFLPLQTRLQTHKQLQQVGGTLTLPGQDAVAVQGYEIHAGLTTISPAMSVPLQLSTGPDGCMDADQNVFGTYLHGLFDTPAACRAILQWAGLSSEAMPDIHAMREQSINRVADVLEAHLDLEQLFPNLA